MREKVKSDKWGEREGKVKPAVTEDEGRGRRKCGMIDDRSGGTVAV